MDKQVIHFTSVPISTVDIVENAMPLNILTLKGLFKNQEIQAVNQHPKAELKSFFKQFNKLKTAGGLVYHPHTESYLWIKRLGVGVPNIRYVKNLISVRIVSGFFFVIWNKR